MFGGSVKLVFLSVILRCKILGHCLEHMMRMGIFAVVAETAQLLLFDCDALALVRFTVFDLMSKDRDIFKENMAGCIQRYCRLIDLPVAQE